MPSWITHLVTANKLCEKIDVKDRNSFLFGNIMPDILNNYIVKETNVHKDYEITHFTKDVVINGVKYDFPDYNKFFEQYKGKMKNPIVCGFYIHLLTDYFWNKLSYGKYYREHNGLVEVKFLDGSTKEYEFDLAIKVKQEDFRIFTEYLKANNSIDRIIYNDDILNLGKDIVEVPLTKEDVNKTLNAVDKYLTGEISTSKKEYNLFTQEILNNYFEESIDFIIDNLNIV